MLCHTHRAHDFLFDVRLSLRNIGQTLIPNVLMVDLTEMCVIAVWQVRARHKVQMFRTGARYQILQAANAHFHAIAVTLLQHGK